MQLCILRFSQSTFLRQTLDTAVFQTLPTEKKYGNILPETQFRVTPTHSFIKRKKQEKGQKAECEEQT